jgi:imidazolonepropionase-like amidohydrolase/Tol biopolymer transport system component
MKLLSYFFIVFILFSQKWKVDSTLSAEKNFQLESNEATWINLDVSADKKWLVFDAVGDIYIMPLKGGDAKVLTNRRSWDSQPRFSPDGKWISYTSDLAGEDNIWIMKTDGSDSKQITKEDDRLPNNAIWHPKKPYLIVKKHYRDRRSLGAGAIWLYHLDGGNGLELVKEPNWTANQGEPAITPDGKYIYFVASTAFDYNKDPNKTIYWIERYNTEEGKVDETISRQGGSVRPEISPSGKYLSFINRKRNKSRLMIKDLSSGIERELKLEIDRDQQEAWAVFGAYHNYTWVDDNTIVIAIDGKIYKVNAISGQKENIPFKIKIEKPMTQTVLFENRINDEEDVKLIRWPLKNEKRIIFQALGKLYQKKGNKSPEFLMNNRFNVFMPKLSKDGKKLVFAAWSDKEKGAIYLADEDGDDLEKITSIPEQYTNPTFSNNGRLIAYLKGKNLASNLNLGWESSFDLVLYNGKTHTVIKEVSSRYANKRMPSLYFSADDNRIFIVEEEAGNTILKSVNLQGFDDKIHISSKYAEEIVPSPDFNYIAYKYLHKIYVTPFIDEGKTITLSDKDGQSPVKLLSSRSGDYINWYQDKIMWQQGAFLYSVSSKNILNEKINLDSVNLSFKYQTRKADGRIALTNVTIISMEGSETISNASILIENNRIVDMGQNISIPKNTKIMDLKGKYIIPGFVDVHSHMHYNSLDVNLEQNWEYIANLAYGVTTTHDPSASTQAVFAQSEMVKSGAILGPRIFSTGFILYGAENDNKAVVNSYDDALGHLQRLKDLGAFSVKSYNQLNRKKRQMIIKAAKALEMNVYPEGGSTHYYNMSMVQDGHTGIEHNLPIAELKNDIIQFVGQSGTNITPTLVVNYGGMSGENYWYQTTNVWENEKLLNFVPRTIIDSRSRRRTMAPMEEYYHINVSQTLKKLYDAGTKIQLGSHGQLQGMAAHWELWSFAQGGMTNLEALKCATIHGAEYLGMEKDLGSIRKGKLADLIVLNANPLEDIKNTEKIAYVMSDGRLFESNTMNQLWPKEINRPAFFFNDFAGSFQSTLQCSCQGN